MSSEDKVRGLLEFIKSLKNDNTSFGITRKDYLIKRECK